jgi:glutamate---cysteine ligase / carboxylate-amine ligase
MNYLRTLLNDPNGTGADRQIAVHQSNNDVDEVIALLMVQTMQGGIFEIKSRRSASTY